MMKRTHLVDTVTEQALAEMPQIMNADERQEALEAYINGMTNIELLELIERSYTK